jgi:Transposase DDE domain
MSQQSQSEIRQNLVEQLDWQVAERDDQKVAQALYAGEKADGVHTLDEAGLLDEFFAFLETSEILAFWKGYEIQALQRVFLPTIYFVLLYGSRILFGIESMNALPVLLFSNVAVMTLIGFNAQVVRQGLTKRGAQQRTGERLYALMDAQTLAATICKSSGQELERLFNGTIHCLARFGLFMAEMMVALDGTKISTTKNFAGCGCLSVSKTKRTRQGLQVEVVELLFGWRLIVLIDLTTLMPIAMKVVQIQEHESPHLIALVKQAQANLAPYSRIVTLVADRAYLDGADLYALDQMQIRFVVIAKTNMAVYGTALCKSVETDLSYERSQTVAHGHGRNQTSATLLTRIQVVTDIRTWESYRPPKEAGKPLRFADRPALNAVLVRIWNNVVLEQPRIFLTNGSVAQPWLIVDLYDDRSWIENGLFRNTKQFWSLTRWFPKRDEAGVRTHLTFVLLMTATATAFRLWTKANTAPPTLPDPPATPFALPTSPNHTPDTTPDAAPPATATHLAATLSAAQPPAFSHHLLAGQGPSRWRQELTRLNRDKLIVFFGTAYGIFDIPVFLTLTGVPFQLPPDFDSHDAILIRYGILQE